ncbi:MAG: phosphatase PAP2 family protein [Actinobacteria bacterium]|nr:phosphatase PAP2 family protein [Actinomycetota bacterium]
MTVVAGAICGSVFAAVTQDVLANDRSVLVDPGISRSVIGYRTGWVTSLMRATTRLGSTLVLATIVLAIGSYFLAGKRRDWRPGLLLVCSLAGANALCRVVKPLVGRSGPPDPFHLVTATGSSFTSEHPTAFPSGHVTAAVAVWGMVAILLGSGSQRRAVSAWFGAAIVVLLVGGSRVYLGVHWWTDVVGGYALGGFWLCLVVSVMLVLRDQRTVAQRPVPADARD